LSIVICYKEFIIASDSTHCRNKTCIQSFNLKTWKERDRLEYLGVDGRII
jgi:hypothetical protein